MFWLGMMKHLAKIALVEVLSAHWTMLEMLRLGLGWLGNVSHGGQGGGKK
ncbi:hypothetical protein [Mesorhizobium sp.]|nr:hypothetical protein [Mesorhizobium sp.]